MSFRIWRTAELKEKGHVRALRPHSERQRSGQRQKHGQLTTLMRKDQGRRTPRTLKAAIEMPPRGHWRARWHYSYIRNVPEGRHELNYYYGSAAAGAVEQV